MYRPTSHHSSALKHVAMSRGNAGLDGIACVGSFLNHAAMMAAGIRSVKAERVPP
ncbi:hypothetical protein [Nitrosomonas sp.]|uniref:hypothetical protein n=1 Tax=Nitrosomonas sp. TaxID=42353 RepID=UPI001D6606E7|nr:hypothetical protein [Nitrosomonas sp.]MCB1950030.1 hypothetical protein [Nitrosomonas sp.]